VLEFADDPFTLAMTSHESLGIIGRLSDDLLFASQVETFKQEFSSMDKEAQLAKLRDMIAPHMLRR
jgi:hypothetical protein